MLSKITLFFGLYIIISAAFMQQAWDLVKRALGRSNSELALVASLCVIALLLLIYYIRRHRFTFLKLAFSACIIFIAFIFAWHQKILVERVHVLEYGFLGWMAARDLIGQGNKLIKPFLAAFLFAFMIGAGDELLQKYLPYRVGELRDVATNIASSFLGIILFIADRK